MCYEYDWEQRIRRAQESLEQSRKIEEELRRKPKPAAPEAAPAPKTQQEESIPV